MALVTYPLNNIEYSAEDAELFHVTRTSGIYAKNSFDCSVTGADNTIVIGTGIGWIKNSEFSGKVIALKEAMSLDMGLPNSVYPRIDAVAIQFDANTNETNIVVKQGVAASSPIAPSVIQNKSVYELHLYHVRREVGSLYIAPSNITDLRLNNVYCGIMADSVTNIDTTAIEKQVSDLIKSLQDDISNVKDGSAYLLRDGSTEMNANLPMGGFKVTGLGTPTAGGDAVPMMYANQNFAPAGYGLGETARGTYITSASDLDSIKKNGWYALWADYNIDIAGFTNSFFTLEVAMFNDNYGRQTVHMASDGSVTRICNNGTWGEWEWVNPSMALDTEYRTTERWESKAVYTQLYDFGSLPNNSSASITVSGSIKILRCSAYCVGSGGVGISLPYYDSSGNQIYCTTVGTSIIIYSNYNASGLNGYVTVWYTKD